MTKRFSILSRVTLIALTGVSFIILAFTSGYVAASFQPRQRRATSPQSASTASNSHLGLFQEAWDLIEKDFFGSLPPNRDRIYGAARGLLDTLGDPYSILVEPIPHQIEQDNLRGSYGGVGLDLSRNQDGQVVLSPVRNSPAADAGIFKGDILLAVDRVALTAEFDLSLDVAARIRGKVGTDVTLTIQRGESILDFTITRAIVRTPSVTWQLLDQSPTLGYLRIKSFTDRTADELDEGLDALLSAGIDGLVLDLRDNGGGLLQSAIDVADRFLDGGAVLHESRKGREEETFKANSGGRALDIPLVVLVNHGTASASEIVAGAIQDRARGTLVGESTFGKGSVQLIFNLSDGSSLHVTSAHWYTPNGHLLDGVGLTPDLAISAGANPDVDQQLERAIEFLEKTNEKG